MILSMIPTSYCTIIILILESFTHQRQLMVLHWSLSDSKSSQVSRTLLSILIWWCSLDGHPLSSYLHIFQLGIVPITQIIIGITATFMFHSFFSVLQQGLGRLLLNFQFYFKFLTILPRVFNQDLAWGNRVIICILYIYVFDAFSLCYFSNHIDKILRKRWAVLQSAMFCISLSLGLPGILLMCLSVPFLIIPSAPTITGTVVVLKCHNL